MPNLAVQGVNRLAWVIGSGLSSGLFPIAPATAGSLLAVVLYYFSPIGEDSLALYLLVGIGFVVGIWATGSLITPSNHDPKLAVWDEFIGIWVTCILMPKTLPWMVVAFFCFRFMDIVKPWPIRKLERLPGGLGIMSDDLLAGVYGAVLLNTIRVIFF